MQTFYQYTTGIVLLSVAVLVLIYRDTYRIALHVSRYLSYRITAVSSQPYLQVRGDSCVESAKRCRLTRDFVTGQCFVCLI